MHVLFLSRVPCLLSQIGSVGIMLWVQSSNSFLGSIVFATFGNAGGASQKCEAKALGQVDGPRSVVFEWSEYDLLGLWSMGIRQGMLPFFLFVCFCQTLTPQVEPSSTSS